MIDGLRLTFPGEELRRLLEERINAHLRRAGRWKREQARTPEKQTEDEPLLPEHICENEADLDFGELLPEKPGWLEQEEYEERTSVGFHLERLTKMVGEVLPREYALAVGQAGSDERLGDA